MNGSLLSLLGFDSDQWIAIIAIVGGLLVGVISVLVWLQVEMTKAMRGRREDPKLAARFDALEAHVADLTADVADVSEKVNQQALAPDDVRSSARG